MKFWFNSRQTRLSTAILSIRFRRENTAIRQVIAKIQATLAEISGLEDGQECKTHLLQLRQSAIELMDIDEHYQRGRARPVLFPREARHYRSIQGVWAKYDNIRAALKHLNQAARDWPATAAEGKKLSGQCVSPALAVLEEMIFKEENILLPMSLKTLTDNEWAEIWASSPKIWLVPGRTAGRIHASKKRGYSGANSRRTSPLCTLWQTKEDSCNTTRNWHVETEAGIASKAPGTNCWGCDKYCAADDLRCGNGTIRTQHPVELLGPDWLEWELNGDRRLIANVRGCS